MANVVNLHGWQLLLSDGSPAKYAQVTFCENLTTTQRKVYSDPSCAAEFERSQPVVCDVYGVLPPCYMAESTAYRIVATDENLADLPGFPRDNITPEPTDASGADSISFTPTDNVTATTVQLAIEQLAALFTDQSNLTARENKVWTTGGTGNAYTITPDPAITAYTPGLDFWVKWDRTNTGAATLNVNGLGAMAIQKSGQEVSVGPGPIAVAVGDLIAYRETLVSYDGARFIIKTWRDKATYGNEANGRWFRLGTGLAIYISPLTLTYGAASYLQATWSLPAGGFLATPSLVGGFWRTLSATNVQLDELMSVHPPVAPSQTSATLRVYRSRASSNSFVNGDTLTIYAFALGVF